MAGTPLVGTINAERVVVAHEIHGGIHAQEITVLSFPSGQRIQRVFAGVPAQGPPLVGRDQTFAELRARAAAVRIHVPRTFCAAGADFGASLTAFSRAQHGWCPQSSSCSDFSYNASCVFNKLNIN